MKRLAHGLACAALALFAATGHANPAEGLAKWDDRYDHHFRKYAKRYFGPHFDWRWFKAQAIAESHLRTTAVSHAGATGIMQLMPATFEDIQRAQPHIDSVDSAEDNIAAGIFYDRQLFRKWDGLPEQERLYLTLASYNAGYARVRRAYNRVKTGRPSWESIKVYLPAETRAYVARIRQLMDEERQAPRMTRLAYLFDA